MSASADMADAAWLLPRRALPARLLALAACGSLALHAAVVYVAGPPSQAAVDPPVTRPGVELSVLPSEALFEDGGGQTTPVLPAAVPEPGPAAPAAPVPLPDVATPAPGPRSVAQAPRTTTDPVRPTASGSAPVAAAQPARPPSAVATIGTPAPPSMPSAATLRPANPAATVTSAERRVAQPSRPTVSAAITAAPAGAAAITAVPGPAPAARVVGPATASQVLPAVGTPSVQPSLPPAQAVTTSSAAAVAASVPAPAVATTTGTAPTAATSDSPASAAAPVAPVAASRAPIELAARGGSGSGGEAGDDCFGWALARADGRERILPAGASLAALGGGTGTCPIPSSAPDAGSARLLSAERTDIRAGEAARGRIGDDASGAPPLLFILDARGRAHDARAFLTRDAAGWSYDIPLTLPRGTAAMRTLIVAIPGAEAASVPGRFAATPLGEIAPALDAVAQRFAISALTVRSP